MRLEVYLSSVTEETIRMKFHVRTLQICGLLSSASMLPALAQTAAPATCATAPTSIKNLFLERTVNLGLGAGTVTPPVTPPPTGGVPANPGLFSTRTPTVPAALVAPILAGALEVRQQLSLNTQTNELTISSFAAQ